MLDLRPLSALRSLQLFGNPLEYLPELSHCTALRHLSLANVRISADQVAPLRSHPSPQSLKPDCIRGRDDTARAVKTCGARRYMPGPA